MGFCQLGYYIAYRHQQAEQKRFIKQNIFSQIKDDDLTVISLSDNASKIFWEEKGKEFHFNNELYDVVKTITINGKVLLYCINDKIEKELINKYNLITKHNSSSDKKSKHVTDNMVKLFVYTEETQRLLILSAKKQYFSFREDKADGIKKILSPPPRA